MAESAVEFLHSEYKRILGSVLVDVQKMFAVSDSFEKSKEMQERQKDDFAIGFMDWFLKQSPIRLSKPTGIDNSYIRKPSKEILEIYKNEKAL